MVGWYMEGQWFETRFKSLHRHVVSLDYLQACREGGAY